MNLYKHQKDIVSADLKKTGFFLGTGSGKSLTALLLARGKTLVIAPKTQKEDGNWEREVKKNNIKIDLTVISKETFRRDWEALPRYDTVICDEAHTILGATPNIRWVRRQPIPKCSQLFDALEEFIKKTNPERLYLCTATIIRSPMTVWAAGRILGKDWDFYAFRSVYYTRLPIPKREIWIAKSDPATKDRLALVVRSLGYTGRLEDYFDVPDQSFKTEYVDLTADQKKRISEMALEYPDPLVRCGKVHQIENGILSGDEFSAPEYFKNNKTERIIEYAEEFPRMIVFAKYTAQINHLHAELGIAGKNVFVLNGQTPDRGELLAQAKASDNYVFICQSQISSGWELPQCPVVIFASKTYSFVDYDQALGRVQRADHIKKNLYISLVAKGGTDEAVEKCVTNKKDFSERIYVNNRHKKE